MGHPSIRRPKARKSIRGRGHEREEGWRVRPEREGGDKILGERGRSAQEAGQRDKRSWEFYGAVGEEAHRKAIVLKRTRWRLFWGCGCLGWPLFRPFCASGSKALHIAHPAVRRLVDSIQSSLQWLGSVVREARTVSTAGYTYRTWPPTWTCIRTFLGAVARGVWENMANKAKLEPFHLTPDGMYTIIGGHEASRSATVQIGNAMFGYGQARAYSAKPSLD